MALHFEGDREFPQSPQSVWEKLHDAAFLARCIPDVEEVTSATPTLLTCRIRPGFAFVRGTLDLVLEVTEAVPATSIRLQLRTKGIGSSSAIQAAMEFSANGPGTRLHWTVDVVELGGLLKAVPSGLIRAAAQKVISDAWDRVGSQIESAA